MKKSSLMAVWGIFYISCAGLGSIPEPEGSVRVFLALIALLFFVPPAILLFDAFASQDRKTILLIRRLSLLSLGLTLALLVVCSAPMFCSNYWALSLFLWAVLLVTTLQKRKEK